jgi:hypothetical protein
MADCLDDAVGGDRPDFERRPCLASGKAMIAVDLCWFTVDVNDLTPCYVAFDAL